MSIWDRDCEGVILGFGSKMYDQNYHDQNYVLRSELLAEASSLKPKSAGKD